MNKLLLLCLIAITFTAAADDKIIGPTVKKCWTYSAHMDDKYQSLPALYRICAKLNIGKCDGGLFYFNSSSQTDPELWYVGTSSSPEPWPPTDCYRATAIQHYYTWDGTRGTTWACLAPPEDDVITAAELQTIVRYVKRLNSIGIKTLSEHQAAMGIKQYAKSRRENPGHM